MAQRGEGMVQINVEIDEAGMEEIWERVVEGIEVLEIRLHLGSTAGSPLYLLASIESV